MQQAELIDTIAPWPMPAPPSRAAIEATIEQLIALLDAEDGDPDIEANGDEFEDAEGDYISPGDWMMSTSWAPPGSCDDDEDGDLIELPRKAA